MMDLSNLRVVFMGSPDFAVPVLRGLAANYSMVGVVTQPDRPSGRGRQLTPPPVKSAAEELGLGLIQPEKLRQPGVFEQLCDWSPDVIIVAAFGQILRQNVLDLPKYGCVNVHASLLPRWRGAAPIQAAILHGDPESGVTIMKMDAGIDTGATLSRRAIPIEKDDTALSLAGKLAGLGAALLLDTLPGYMAGELIPVAQDETGATYAGMIKKEMGLLDFEKPAQLLERQIRAFIPWPGSWFVLDGQPCKVLGAEAARAGRAAIPGSRQVAAGFPALICADETALILKEIQPAGKRAMPGDVFLRGYAKWVDK